MNADNPWKLLIRYVERYRLQKSLLFCNTADNILSLSLQSGAQSDMSLGIALIAAHGAVNWRRASRGKKAIDLDELLDQHLSQVAAFLAESYHGTPECSLSRLTQETIEQAKDAYGMCLAGALTESFGQVPLDTAS